MLNVCEDYAKEYNILFNASKSELQIDYVEQCVHIGTVPYSDISIRNINNAVNDLFMRTNNLMVDFSNVHSSTLFVLYNSYCMNVYGSQLWCFNDYKYVELFYTTWRKTI